MPLFFQKPFQMLSILGNGVSRKIAFEIFWPLVHNKSKQRSLFFLSICSNTDRDEAKPSKSDKWWVRIGKKKFFSLTQWSPSAPVNILEITFLSPDWCNQPLNDTPLHQGAFWQLYVHLRVIFKALPNNSQYFWKWTKTNPLKIRRWSCHWYQVAI